MDHQAQEVYEQWHRAYERTGADDATAPWHDLARSALTTFDFSGKRVLEIACGRGGFSRWLAERGAIVTAADFSASAVDITKQRLAEFPRATAEEQDLESLSYSDESFDLVVSLETLEHLPSPLKGVSELTRVTKRGGHLLVTGPNYLGTSGIYRAYRALVGRPFTENGQPINQLLFLPVQVRRFRQAGCQIDKTAGVGHYFFWPGHNPMRIRWLDRLSAITKWSALHTLICATRL